MGLPGIFKSKKLIYFGVFFVVLFIFYSFLRYFLFRSDPLIPLLSILDDNYLLLAEQFANKLLYLLGSSYAIDHHIVFFNNEQMWEIVTVTILKKWALLLFLFIWLTKSSLKNRILFTVLVVLVNFFLLSSELAFSVRIDPSIEHVRYIAIMIFRTVGVLSMTSILFLWYWKNKEVILGGIQKLGINTELLERKFSVIVILTYIYAIVGIFLLQYFNYLGWINFIFEITRKILLAFGYVATVDTFYLIGEHGTIYMAKYCLGFKTMLLFASLVFLTAENIKRSLIYIGAGLVFLNIVNIFRFVFLFIHIQKHSGYELAIDLHDMYKYITYSIVFILWVIWFEKVNKT